MPATVLPGPPPVRRRLWVRVLLWSTGVAVAVLAAMALLLTAALSGGFDDLLSLPGPTESDEEVVAAGEQALADLAREPLPVAGPAAVAEDQECAVGQHNWKIDDEYDLSCVATRTALGTGDVPAFRAQALALHEQLVADGWRGDHTDIASVLGDYWDVRSTGGGYGPGDLPQAGYTRGELRLEVRWLSAGDRLPRDTHALGGGAFLAPDGSPVDPWSLVPPGGYVVALSVSTESFRA